MAFPRLLQDVDADEVSLVRRGANRRKFLLMKGDDVEGLDPEMLDMLSVPAPGEGAVLDEIRKDGIDGVTEDALVMAMRLVHGVKDELSRESVEKLGGEMYGRENPALNTSGGVDAPGDLVGSADSAEKDADGDNDEQPDNDPDDIAVGKDDFSADDRKNLASQGKALPDGSYPIRNKSDLGNAIQAYGRAKDKGRAKAWIIRRAKALGATSMLPESWNVSKSDDNNPEGGTVGSHAVPVQKEDGSWDFTDVPDETRAAFEAVLKQAEDAKQEQEEEASAREQIAKAQEERISNLESALKRKELVEKAETEFGKVGPSDEIADILQDLPQDKVEKLEAVLKAANEKIETGDLFAELGRASRGPVDKPDSAYAEAVAKADALVEKSSDGMSRDEALGKVWQDNPELYDRYQREHPALSTWTPAAGGER